jgi:hypothetical protein
MRYVLMSRPDTFYSIQHPASGIHRFPGIKLQ